MGQQIQEEYYEVAADNGVDFLNFRIPLELGETEVISLCQHIEANTSFTVSSLREYSDVLNWIDITIP